MKRILKTLLIVFALVFTLSLFASAERFVTVKLDGEVLEFDVQAQIINGRTMVPLRKIFESMGAEVFWDKETYTAIGVKGSRSVQAQINSTSFFVNEEEKIFDTPAMLIDGRTLVPLRFVAEAYGAVVDWDDATSTATIISPEKIPLEEIVSIPYRTDLSEYIILAKEDYTGLEYLPYEHVATEAEILSYLELILDEYTELVDVTTPCKIGDTVNIDYEGFMNGEPLENGADSGSEFVLGNGGFIDGFESGIVGHVAGEEFSIDVVFPSDYGYEALQGAKVTFKMKLNAVKEAYRPELTDEFIAQISEFDTVVQCIEYIGRMISKQNTENARIEVANTLFEKILQKAQIKKLPEEAYMKKKAESLANYESMAGAYGMTLEDLVTANGMTMEDFEKAIDEEVTNSFLTELALYYIANAENIIPTVNKADYIEIVDQIALNNSVTYEYVVENASSDSIVTYVILEAVIDFILENGKMTIG